MRCRSAIYAANTSEQVINAGKETEVIFGPVVRACGFEVTSGRSVTVSGNGYYIADTNCSINTAGKAVIQFYANDTAIPGAAAEICGAMHNISIPFMMHDALHRQIHVTAKIKSSGAAVITNAAILIQKFTT